jgi:hypothetical protein
MELPKIKSIINDLDHIPQKRGKVIKELPNGRFIPKEMQKMSGKGWTQVTDDDLFNSLIEALWKEDEKEGAFITHDDIQLYMIANCVIIYEGNTGLIFATKESPLHELTPEYWASLTNTK